MVSRSTTKKFDFQEIKHKSYLELLINTTKPIIILLNCLIERVESKLYYLLRDCARRNMSDKG